MRIICSAMTIVCPDWDLASSAGTAQHQGQCPPDVCPVRRRCTMTNVGGMCDTQGSAGENPDGHQT